MTFWIIVVRILIPTKTLLLSDPNFATDRLYDEVRTLPNSTDSLTDSLTDPVKFYDCEETGVYFRYPNDTCIEMEEVEICGKYVP